MCSRLDSVTRFSVVVDDAFVKVTDDLLKFPVKRIICDASSVCTIAGDFVAEDAVAMQILVGPIDNIGTVHRCSTVSLFCFY